MIAGQLQRLAQRQPNALALVTAKQRFTYSQLLASANSVAGSISDIGVDRVGVWCDEMPALVATLLALDSLGIDAVLISGGATSEHVRSLAERLGLSLVLGDKSPSSEIRSELRFHRIDLAAQTPQAFERKLSRDSQIILFTSGTSGRPKPAVHTWSTLSAGLNRDPKYAGRRWLLAYEPTSFAGIQVWLQALLTGGCLSIPESRDPSAAAERLLADRVEFASATPSFWRLLLVSVSKETLAETALEQITLGGEPIDQSILDALRSAFPKARITHIYASTEMGVCFSVSDGKAGFPASYLNNPNLPVALRISDTGELEIRSQRAMLGYVPESADRDPSSMNSAPRLDWFATGDLVEQRGDRIYFVGRKSETINVGGMKVYPTDVEQCIQQVPGVQAVRVFSVPSSITGQLVGAEIQPAIGVDLRELQRQIVSLCRKRLARHQVPTSIKFRERLPLNESGKVLRGEAVEHG